MKVQFAFGRTGSAYEFGHREIYFYIDLSPSERIQFAPLTVSVYATKDDMYRTALNHRDELEVALRKYVESVT